MPIKQKTLLRVIDANFNRAKEGLRVCEDVLRFIFNDASTTLQLKNIRHGLTRAVDALGLDEMIKARDIGGDVGVKTTASELKRQDITEVIYANSQRVKESIRVLEEVAKLLDVSSALKLKKLRYQFYALEQKMLKKR